MSADVLQKVVLLPAHAAETRPDHQMPGLPEDFRLDDETSVAREEGSRFESSTSNSFDA